MLIRHGGLEIGVIPRRLSMESTMILFVDNRQKTSNISINSETTEIFASIQTESYTSVG